MHASQVDIDEAIRCWEKQLRDEKAKKALNIFFKGPKDERNEIAIALFRYVFERVLEKSPREIVNYLTLDMIKELGLIKAFYALNFPSEYKDRRCAVFYVGILCYPSLQKYYRREDLWVMEYNKCIEKGKNHYLAFDEANLNACRDKARYLLNHVLICEHDVPAKNIWEMYEFFSSKKANLYLAKHKLGAAVKFFDSPLDYFNQSLAADVPKDRGRNEFVLLCTEINTSLKERGI